jgi:hypothetical protein
VKIIPPLFDTVIPVKVAEVTVIYELNKLNIPPFVQAIFLYIVPPVSVRIAESNKNMHPLSTFEFMF